MAPVLQLGFCSFNNYPRSIKPRQARRKHHPLLSRRSKRSSQARFVKSLGSHRGVNASSCRNCVTGSILRICTIKHQVLPRCPKILGRTKIESPKAIRQTSNLAGTKYQAIDVVALEAHDLPEACIQKASPMAENPRFGPTAGAGNRGSSIVPPCTSKAGVIKHAARDNRTAAFHRLRGLGPGLAVLPWAQLSCLATPPRLHTTRVWVTPDCPSLQSGKSSASAWDGAERISSMWADV